MNNTIPETKDCKACRGTGVYDHEWLWDEATKTGKFGSAPCNHCGATGKISKPDFDKILNVITKNVKGSTKRQIRASKPKFENEHKNPEEGRAYYVWRLARFHGGKDVTMPVIAGMCVHYDPYEPELDAYASLVAKQVFGTDLAAAYRWGNALGFLNTPTPVGLPATAYGCGPVCDETKPAEEQPELL